MGDSSLPPQPPQRARACGQVATWVPALTIGHELHDKPWVGDVGAAHLGATHALTHLRYYTRNLVCGKDSRTLLVGTGNSNENEMGPLVGGGAG